MLSNEQMLYFENGITGVILQWKVYNIAEYVVEHMIVFCHIRRVVSLIKLLE